MDSIFTLGVRKKSEQLMEVSARLSEIIRLMEAKKDLATFDRRYPGLLPDSIMDLKEARKLMVQALDRLNFPERSRDHET
jgi:hypothetical protein